MELKQHHKNFLARFLAGIFVFLLIYLISKFSDFNKLKNQNKKIEKEKEISTVLKKMNKQQFIDFLLPALKVINAKYKIPVQFMLAQIALETGWGKSELFYKYFNVGGIRSFHPEKEDNVLEWTHEDVLTSDLNKWPQRDKSKDVKKVKNGKNYTNIYVKLPFRKFNSLNEGLEYYLKGVLLNKYFKPYIEKSKGDPNKYVELLQSGETGAKYATGLGYVDSIKSLIKEFNNLA